MNAHSRNLDALPVELWKLKSLIRIVAETCDPRLKADEWFRDLAAKAGVDLTGADARNPMVS